MGRIRTVKPELPQQPWFATLTDAAARTYYGILALVDDHGRCPADPLYIGGQIFWGKPRAANVISRQLGELEKAGIIRRYSTRGADYLEILGWGLRGGPLYQQIKDNQGERFPPPEPSDGGSETPSESGVEGRGSGKGAGNRGEGEPPAAPPPARDTPTPTRMPVGWEPSDSELNRAARDQAIARGVDVSQQLDSLRNHAAANGWTRVDWEAAWRKWLSEAHPSRQVSSKGSGAPKRERPPEPSQRPEVAPNRSARPELVPDAPTDAQGNVRDAGPFRAVLAELDRGGQP